MHIFSRFNLVIENLLFSTSHPDALEGRGELPFQSRNRESFIFYTPEPEPTPEAQRCFNLVIENLLFSTYIEAKALKSAKLMFQSRNRESFIFY